MIDLTLKKYFLFDLDGTLVDLEQLNYTCFREEANKKSGKDLSYSEYMTYFAGVGSRRGFEAYFKSIGQPLTSTDDLVNSYRKQKEFFLNNKFEEVVSIKEGIREFLIESKRLGKKLAIGTSTASKFAYLILEKSKLLSLFDVVVTVDDVANTKPAPDIYNRALLLLQGNAQEAVIFEDSANGAKTADDMKIEVIIVRNPGKNDQVVASHKESISSYRELIPRLQ